MWNTGLFSAVGSQIGYRTATPSSTTTGYALDFRYDKTVYLNNHGWARAEGLTIRCIEDCDCLPTIFITINGSELL